jgi:hypothetical protein
MQAGQQDTDMVEFTDIQRLVELVDYARSRFLLHYLAHSYLVRF